MMSMFPQYGIPYTFKYYKGHVDWLIIPKPVFGTFKTDWIDLSEEIKKITQTIFK